MANLPDDNQFELLGPAIEGPTAHDPGKAMWRIVAETLRGVPVRTAQTPVVRENFAMRLLLQSYAPQSLLPEKKFSNEDLKKTELQFRRPVALAVLVRQGGKSASLAEIRFFDGQVKESYKTSLAVEVPHYADLVTQPIGPWIAGTKEQQNLPRFEIQAMRLQSGVLPLRLHADKDPANLLGLHEHAASRSWRIFDAIEFAETPADKLEGPRLDLVAGGFEFDAVAPEVLRRLAGGDYAARREIVRLQAGVRNIKETPVAVLSLVGGEQKFLDAIESGIQAQLALLRGASMVHADFDTRPNVPLLFWKLTRVNNALRAQADDFHLDHRCVRLRLVTHQPVAGGAQSVAHVPVEVANIVGVVGGYDLNLATPGTPRGAPFSVVQEGVGPDAGHLAVPPAMMPIAFNRDALAAQLTQRYAHENVLPPQDRIAPYAFLPLRSGWCQLPLIDCTRTRPPVTAAAPASILTGVLTLRLQGFSQATVEVESVAHLEIVANLRGAAAPNLSSKIYEASGNIRELLYLADASPKPEECLPSLAAGPIATAEQILHFGPAAMYERCGALSAAAAGVQLRLSWQPRAAVDPFAMREQSIVAWLEHAELPYVSSAPLTRTIASGEPLRTRAYLPHEYPVATGIVLSYEPEESLPGLVPGNAAAAATFIVPWLDAGQRAGFSLMLASLPGIETIPGNTLPPFAINAPPLSLRLRYDLPLLDEYFSNIEIPRADSEFYGVNKPQKANRPDSGITTLDPQRLQGFWKLQADRVSTTRTQASIAVDWRPIPTAGAAPVPVLVNRLVEPYSWSATFGFAAKTPSHAMPIGSFTLNGDYFGSIALAGITDNYAITGGALAQNNAGAVHIIGNAAAVFGHATGGLSVDTRGLAIENVAAPIAGAHLLARRTHFQSTAANGIERELVTLALPLDVSLTDCDLRFWCRDLAFERRASGNNAQAWVFDGESSLSERAIGADSGAFNRDALNTSLHEWRLFAPGTGRYDFSLGPFDLRPLRLLKVTLAETQGRPAAVQEVEVICSVSLREKRADRTEVFDSVAADEAHNLVVLSLRPAGGGTTARLQRISITSADGKLTVIRLGVAPSLAKPLEFCFNARPALRITRLEGLYVTPSEDVKETDIQPMRLLLPVDATAAFSASPLTFAPARLELTLFGSRQTLSDGEVTISARASGDAPALHVEFAAYLDGADVQVSAVDFSVDAECVLRVVVPLEIAIKASAEHPLVSWSSENGLLTWMALTATPTRVRVDHATGALWLELSNPKQLTRAELFPGFAIDESTAFVTVLLALGATAREVAPGVSWPAVTVRSAYMELSVQKLERYGARHVIKHGELDPVHVAGGWESRLALDFSAQKRTSRIRWPLQGVTIPANLPQGHPSGQDVTISTVHDPNALEDEIEFEAHDVMCPIESFDARAGFMLTRSIALRMRATHRLKWADGEMSWSTLELAELFDFHSMVLEAEQDSATAKKEHIFAFAPRYRENRYRGENHAAYLAHPAIATRAMAAAGLPDLDAAKFIKNLPSTGSRLVFFGGSLTLFEAKPDERHQAPQGIRWTLPWIAALDEVMEWRTEQQSQGQQGLRAQQLDASGFESSVFADFRQGPRTTGTAQYRVADFDLVAGNASIWDFGRPLSLDATGTQANITQNLLALRNAQIARGAILEGVAHVTAAEQPLIEPLGTGEGNTFTAVDWPQAPIFLRTWLALKTLRGLNISGKQRVSNLVPVGADHDREASIFVRASVTLPSAPRMQDLAEQSHALILLSAAGLRVKTIAAEHANALNDAVGVARVRSEAIAQLHDPVVIAVGPRNTEPNNFSARVAYTAIEASVIGPTFPVMRRSIAPIDDTLFASGAIGWPEDADVSALSSAAAQLDLIAPQLDDGNGDVRDTPFQNTEQGLSGRAASFTGVVSAEEPFDEARTDALRRGIIWTHRHVVFDRSSASNSGSGPPARHLNPGRTRLRVPTTRETFATLRRISGKDSVTGFQSVLPGQYERAVIGARPGVMYVEVDSTLLTTGDRPMDWEQSKFGQPATASPLLVRQQRHPRSTRLPPNDPSTHTRRTFVSWQDVRPQPLVGWEPLRAIPGASTLFRAKDAEVSIEVRVTGEPTAAGVDFEPYFTAANVQKIYLRVAVSKPLQLDVTGSMPLILVQAGLLCPNKTTAILTAGDEIARFKYVKHIDDPQGAANVRYLVLNTIKPRGPEEGVQYLLNSLTSRVSGDQPLVLTLGLDTENWTPNTPQPADEIALGPESDTVVPVTFARQPARSLTVILPVRPTDRSVVKDVHNVLCAFGDPSFDRMLWSRTQREGRPFKVKDDVQRDWLIASDRAEYNSYSKLYFACGPTASNGAWDSCDKLAKYPLTIEVTRKSAKNVPMLLELISGQVPALPVLLRDLKGARERYAHQGDVSAAHCIFLEDLHLVDHIGDKANGEKGQILRERFELLPGDQLSVSAWLPTTTTENSITKEFDEPLSVDVTISVRPVMSTPPSVYSVIAGNLREGGFDALSTALHGSSPMPQVVEFPDLLGDLARGVVQRRGLFLWNYTNTRGDTHVALLKVDRSGGGQMVDELADFVKIS